MVYGLHRLDRLELQELLAAIGARERPFARGGRNLSPNTAGTVFNGQLDSERASPKVQKNAWQPDLRPSGQRQIIIETFLETYHVPTVPRTRSQSITQRFRRILRCSARGSALRAASTEPKTPAVQAWHVTKKGDDSFWTKVGATWPHRGGKGLSLILLAIRING